MNLSIAFLGDSLYDADIRAFTCYAIHTLALVLLFRQKMQTPCTPSSVCMNHFITFSLNTLCSPQIPEKKTVGETKFIAHGRHVACKTDFEANKEVASLSEDGVEGAICRHGLAGARRLAVGIDGRFSVSSWEVSTDIL